MPTFPRRLTGILGAFILAAAVVPMTARPVAAEGGSSLVDVVNDYRADAGLGAVALHAGMDQVAVERGRQIASDRNLDHDLAYVERRLGALGICYRSVGEILAWTSGDGDYARFVYKWSISTSGHREVILGSYTHAGGSRERGGDGRYYAVMIFAKLCGASTPAAPSPSGFSDIGTSQFAADIKWLVAEEITSGCSAGKFCPRSPVARDQMASFLRRATGIPTSTANAYTDDNGSMHEADINGVAAAEISGGCTDVRFCPGSVVTRAQMASFLARALHLPTTSRDYFRDDNGSMHEPAINKLAAAGVTGGCSSGSFCPAASVTREQMAGFLHRAFQD